MSTIILGQQVILPLAARTTGGSSDPVLMGKYSEVFIFVYVDAVSGTSPDLDITIESSADGEHWLNSQSINNINAVGEYRSTLAGYANYVRISYSIGGTSPSFTFSVVMDGTQKQ